VRYARHAAGDEGAGDGEQKAPKPLALTLLELQTFWAGVGLKDFQAESLSMRLVQMQSAYMDVELLAQKFDRLKRCIPGATHLRATAMLASPSQSTSVRA
jgi:hypothetical protein